MTTTLATNLLGVVETLELDPYPYLVDRDGHPFVPAGGAGVVLGPCLGDGVFAFDADHAAPGVTLVHPDQAARHALTAFACLGNDAVVRTGAAAGATGRVLGKRGEAGRVIVVFGQDVLARLVPADSVVIRARGQGATVPTGDVTVLNVDPALLPRLPVGFGARAEVSVRGRVPSHLAGNGVGRPARQWDIDLQVDHDTADRFGLGGLRLGDLVCIDDLDVRHDIGYRKGWVTVGVVVHGSSPLPGHGPGVMPILGGPGRAFGIVVEPEKHLGVTGALDA